jgi:hypothetical protein
MIERLARGAAGVDPVGLEETIQRRSADAEQLRRAQLVACPTGQHQVNVAKDGTIRVRVVFGGHGL